MATSEVHDTAYTEIRLSDQPVKPEHTRNIGLDRRIIVHSGTKVPAASWLSRMRESEPLQVVKSLNPLIFSQKSIVYMEAWMTQNSKDRI